MKEEWLSIAARSRNAIDFVASALGNRVQQSATESRGEENDWVVRQESDRSTREQTESSFTIGYMVRSAIGGGAKVMRVEPQLSRVLL